MQVLTEYEFIKDNFRLTDRIALGINAYNVVTIKKYLDLLSSGYGDGEEGIYRSISPLYNHATKRCKKNVSRPLFLFADLDVWHSNSSSIYCEALEDDVLTALEAVFESGLFVEPTYLISTGRGYLLLWRVFENDNKSKDIYRGNTFWNKLQKYIASIFSDFGYDPSSTFDLARIFRVLQSKNELSTVQAVKYDKNKTYSIYRLASEYLDLKKTKKQQKLLYRFSESGIDIPSYLEVENAKKADVSRFIRNHLGEYIAFNTKPTTKKQIKYCEDLARQLHIELPDGYDTNSFIAKSFLDKHKYNRKSWQLYESKYAGAMIVTKSIIENYVAEHSDCKGVRETLLWLYMVCAYGLTKDTKESFRLVSDLNAHYSEPLDDSEWQNTVKSGITYNDNYQKFVCNKLSKVLNVPFKNLKHNYYKRQALSVEQKTLYNKIHYRDKLKEKGVQTKQEKITERLMALNKLLKQGKKRKEILTRLNISLSTYNRDLKKLKELKKSVKFSDLYNKNGVLPATSTPFMTDQDIFVTGGAGTGKSYLVKNYIRSLSDLEQDCVLCLAPTNKVAADFGFNCKTIHKALHLPASIIRPDLEVLISEDLLNIKTIVIDEIGLVRADIMEYILRFKQLHPNKLRLILIGDTHQLDPFVSKEDYEEYVSYYGEDLVKKPCFYNAPSFCFENFKLITLKEGKRYASEKDSKIIKMIDDGDERCLPVLNSLVKPEMKYAEDAIHLCTKNSTVADVNQTIMLNHREQWIQHTIKDTTTIYYPGMPIIFTRNRNKGKNCYQKGLLGVILKCSKKRITVLVGDKKLQIYVSKKYPLPFEAAYAITKYKSQGATISEKIVIHDYNYGRQTLYVAISRTRKIEDVSFIEPVSRKELL